MLYDKLLVFAEQISILEPPDGSALPEALRISAIAMMTIFFVMGLFGSMISLLSRIFPESNDK